MQRLFCCSHTHIETDLKSPILDTDVHFTAGQKSLHSVAKNLHPFCLHSIAVWDRFGRLPVPCNQADIGFSPHYRVNAQAFSMRSVARANAHSSAD